MMVVEQTKPSPTRCAYYEARSSAVPVPTGERFALYDRAVRPDDVLGADTRIRLEVVDRESCRTAAEWPGVDGQPDSQLSDTAEPGGRRVGIRPGHTGQRRRVLQGAWRDRDVRDGAQRAQGVEREMACGASAESAVFRYPERFHDADEEAKREAHRAFIPAPNEALRGLWKVNTELVDNSSAGLQSKLSDEAAGVGWPVSEQASEGSPLHPDRPCWACGASRQAADHPPSRGHSSYALLVRARLTIAALAATPP